MVERLEIEDNEVVLTFSKRTTINANQDLMRINSIFTLIKQYLDELKWASKTSLTKTKNAYGH